MLPEAPRRHDYQTGLHANQLRPFLQLLKAVAPIKPIDLPERDGIMHLRYWLAGEVRTCGSADGDVATFLLDLNTQLHELRVPYQFVFLAKDKKAKKQIPDRVATPLVITLLNSATYRQCQTQLPKQAEPQFARSRFGAAEPFTRHIQDLPTLRLNPGLAKRIDAGPEGGIFPA
jgi:hypothetical protein